MVNHIVAGSGKTLTSKKITKICHRFTDLLAAGRLKIFDTNFTNKTTVGSFIICENLCNLWQKYFNILIILDSISTMCGFL